MACSYRGLTVSGEIRPDASCRIASTSSGGLGMLPIGSGGIGLADILPAEPSAVKGEERARGGKAPRAPHPPQRRPQVLAPRADRTPPDAVRGGPSDPPPPLRCGAVRSSRTCLVL